MLRKWKLIKCSQFSVAQISNFLSIFDVGGDENRADKSCNTFLYIHKIDKKTSINHLTKKKLRSWKVEISSVSWEIWNFIET